jgi:hypothetical protein
MSLPLWREGPFRSMGHMMQEVIWAVFEGRPNAQPPQLRHKPAKQQQFIVPSTDATRHSEREVAARLL